VATSVNRALDLAIAAADHVEPAWRWYRAVADWWRGTSVETAWRNIHLAEEQLILRLSPDQLRARWGNVMNIPVINVAGSSAPLDGEAIRQAVMAVHGRSDSQHERARVARNLLYLATILIAAIVGGLWGGHVVRGDVVGLGALGGAASIAFAFRSAVPSGPYNTLVAQSLVKIPLGAATAAMAVILLSLGSRFTSSATDAYAVIFGFSQQAFSQLIDQKTSSLAGDDRASPQPVSGAKPNQASPGQ
jgi:hypothetical protein